MRLVISVYLVLYALVFNLGAPVKKPRHEPLHEPGSKDQLLEAWEEEDGMSADNFDPKSFFMMHDLNGNQELSKEEIDVILERELEKLNTSETRNNQTYADHVLKEMREYFLQHFDKDSDGKVSMPEFINGVGLSTTGPAEEWVPEEDKLWEQAMRQEEEEARERERRAHEMHPVDPLTGQQPSNPDGNAQAGSFNAQPGMHPNPPVQQQEQQPQGVPGGQVPLMNTMGSAPSVQHQFVQPPSGHPDVQPGFAAGNPVPQMGSANNPQAVPGQPVVQNPPPVQSNVPVGQVPQGGNFGSPQAQPVQSGLPNVQPGMHQQLQLDPTGQQPVPAGQGNFAAPQFQSNQLGSQPNVPTGNPAGGQPTNPGESHLAQAHPANPNSFGNQMHAG